MEILCHYHPVSYSGRCHRPAAYFLQFKWLWCTVLSISFSFFPLTSNCCRGISCGGCRWMALRCPGLQTILPKGSCWYCSRSHPKAPSCYLSFAFLSPIWSSHLSDRKVTQSQDLTFMRGMTLINDKFYDSVQS